MYEHVLALVTVVIHVISYVVFKYSSFIVTVTVRTSERFFVFVACPNSIQAAHTITTLQSGAARTITAQGGSLLSSQSCSTWLVGVYLVNQLDFSEDISRGRCEHMPPI